VLPVRKRRNAVSPPSSDVDEDEPGDDDDDDPDTLSELPTSMLSRLRWLHASSRISASTVSRIMISSSSSSSLGPFHRAIAVPSVTRCRCCRCCGHRFYIAIHQVSLLSHAACAIAVVVVVVVDIDAKAARDSTASDIW